MALLDGGVVGECVFDIDGLSDVGLVGLLVLGICGGDMVLLSTTTTTTTTTTKERMLTFVSATGKASTAAPSMAKAKAKCKRMLV